MSGLRGRHFKLRFRLGRYKDGRIGSRGHGGVGPLVLVVRALILLVKEVVEEPVTFLPLRSVLARVFVRLTGLLRLRLVLFPVMEEASDAGRLAKLSWALGEHVTPIDKRWARGFRSEPSENTRWKGLPLHATEWRESTSEVGLQMASLLP